MGIEVEGLSASMTGIEERSGPEAAINAAHDVQNDVDALCIQIKQLLAASYAINIEKTTADGVGR